MAFLLIRSGEMNGKRLPLSGNRIHMGRDPRCAIHISENMLPVGTTDKQKEQISRFHAVITRDANRYYIEDGDGQGKASHNFTYVNNIKIRDGKRVLLSHNDLIRLCIFEAVFQIDDNTTFTLEASVDHETSSHFLQAAPAERLQGLLEITNSLSRTLDPDVLLPRLVDRLFTLFRQATRGFIVLREEPSGLLVCSVLKTRKDGDNKDARFSSNVVNQCMDKMQAILGNDLPVQFPDSESVQSLPARSLMCAPLWIQPDRPVGAIQIDTDNPRQPFTQDDLNLLMGVANQASIALNNARLHRDSLNFQRRTRDLEVARDVQRALLPRLPTLQGYEFHAVYEPAQEVGGDHYDFVPLPEGRMAILLGDVAGKGVAAALVMVKFSIEVRSCLLTVPDLPSALARVNTLLCEAGLMARFVTLIALVLDPNNHTATLVSAGHPSAFLTRATGSIEEVPAHAEIGPPLGILESQTWQSTVVALHPGDSLILFSDGITEAMNASARQFQGNGVRAVLQNAPHPVRECGDTLMDAVCRHAQGGSYQDDMTLVCLRRLPQ